MLVDWTGVARNTLWIVGLSVALAAWSHARWQAGTLHLGWRKMLERASFRAPFNLGWLLFSVGLAWGATRAWERVAWTILAITFAWQIVVALRGRVLSRDE